MYWLQTLSSEIQEALLLMYTQFCKAWLSSPPAAAEKMLRSFWKVKASLRGEGRRGWSRGGELLHFLVHFCCPTSAEPGTESPSYMGLLRGVGDSCGWCPRGNTHTTAKACWAQRGKGSWISAHAHWAWSVPTAMTLIYKGWRNRNILAIGIQLSNRERAFNSFY